MLANNVTSFCYNYVKVHYKSERHIGGVENYLQTFLIWALVGSD